MASVKGHGASGNEEPGASSPSSSVPQETAPGTGAPGRAAAPADMVEEWGRGSFPASDPPQSWCYEPPGLDQ
ncbi:MAG: hypothetical protein ACRDXC_14150 [Acidimicrobiales bacterium]